ncbi:MAG: hypothetical protein JAY74_14785 [Candidatus Thiodiazotropha taylori]|nr:hypothetical protein [Candidatus Thiodiazotropha taylori]
MVHIRKVNPVDFLVERKYPTAHLLQSRTQASGSSVTNITNTQKGQILTFKAELQAEIQAYKAKLKAMPVDQMLSLFETEQEKYRQEQVIKAEKIEQQRYFNRPSADADYEHWCKAAYWSLDEAIALSFGKEPELVNWKILKNDDSFPSSKFIENYKKIRELVLRAKAVRQLSDPCVPSTFLSWALQTNIDVPLELIKKVETQGNVVANWKHMYGKLKEQHESLEKAYTSISHKLEQLKKNSNNHSNVKNSNYWQMLEQRAEKAIEQYPIWKQSQRKIQKTGNLQIWLLNEIGVDNREAEIIKKILSDIFKEL